MSQQINLLDASLLPPRDWCTGTRIVTLAALLALGLGAHAARESWALRRALAMSATISATISTTASDATATAEATPADDTTAATTQLQRNRALLTAVNGLTDLPRDTAQRITTLTAALPEAVWLREVEFSGQRGVRIVGGTLEPQALAALSARLGATEAFRAQPLRVFSLAPLPAPDDATAPARPVFGFVLSSLDAAPATAP